MSNRGFENISPTAFTPTPTLKLLYPRRASTSVLFSFQCRTPSNASSPTAPANAIATETATFSDSLAQPILANSLVVVQSLRDKTVSK